MNRYRVTGRVRHVQYEYEVRAWSADDAAAQVRLGFCRTSRYDNGVMVDDVLCITGVEPLDLDAEVDRLRAQVQQLAEDLSEARGIAAGLRDAAGGRIKSLQQIDAENQ